MNTEVLSIASYFCWSFFSVLLLLVFIASKDKVKDFFDVVFPCVITFFVASVVFFVSHAFGYYAQMIVMFGTLDLCVIIFLVFGLNWKKHENS